MYGKMFRQITVTGEIGRALLARERIHGIVTGADMCVDCCLIESAENAARTLVFLYAVMDGENLRYG